MIIQPRTVIYNEDTERHEAGRFLTGVRQGEEAAP